MNVTALTHIKSSSFKSNTDLLIDKEAFMEKMNASLAQNELKSSLNSTEDFPQSLDELELEESSDEEVLSFSLINPFLRLQTEVDSLSSGDELQKLHTQNNSLENQEFLAVTDYANEIEVAIQGSVDSASDTDGLIAKNLDVYGDVQEHKLITDLLLNRNMDIPIDKEIQGNNEYNPILDVINASSLIDENQFTDHNSNHNSSSSIDPVLESEVNGRISDITLLNISEDELKESITLNNADQKVIYPESTNGQMNNEQINGIVSYGDNLINSAQSPESPVDKNDISINPVMSDLSESEVNKEDKSPDISTQSLSFDRQINNALIQTDDVKQVPVTKEQSLDYIRELILTAVTDDTGKEVFKSSLTLTPENLGEVKIELIFDQDGLSGKFVFDSDETRIWMESQWQLLKQPLEARGLYFNQFDFSIAEPVNISQSDAFSFSQNDNQSDAETSKESNQSTKAKLITNVEEESISNNRSVNSTGLNIYV